MERMKSWLFSGAATGGLLLVLVAGAAHAFAPPGRYTISANTVVDTKTTLTWQRTVDAHSYTYAGAQTYCAGLALGGVAAGGWRLPNVRELMSIVDVGSANPAIDTAAFPNTPSYYFWTANIDVRDTTQGLSVEFQDGQTSVMTLTDTTVRVRCVH